MAGIMLMQPVQKSMLPVSATFKKKVEQEEG
jgi:hypothetical protein